MRHPLQRFRKKNLKKPIEQKYPTLWTILSLAHKQPTLRGLEDHSSISIDWAEEDQRARKVISRSSMRMTYKYPSKKNKRMVHCESEIELNAMIVLDCCSYVKHFNEQPAKITYFDAEGNSRTHYPDIYVELVSGHRFLLEIKADSESENQELLWRTDYLARELALHGIQYLLVFGSQVSGDLLEAAQTIVRFAGGPVLANHRESMRLTMASRHVTVDEAIEMATRVNSAPKSFIYSLIYEGSMDLISQSLFSDSLVAWRSL